MSLKCSFGIHNWNGCKCKICGKVQNNNHKFVDCICLICGKIQHQWNNETMPCIRCGKVFEIATLDDLDKIRKNLSGHFKLVADIDASETKHWNNQTGFIPIGYGNNPFCGFFDGDNHSITNLFINFKKLNIGLFSAMTGTVSNLKLMNVDITGSSMVGSLTARCQGNIINCKVTGKIRGYSKVGGLAGSIEHSKIQGNTIFCEVLGTTDYSYYSDSDPLQCVGGLAGWSSNSNISECSTVVNVVGSVAVGGLIGFNESIICSCQSDGKVLGKLNVGGLVGKLSSHAVSISKSYISECHSTCNVTGTDYVGGLIGVSNRGISKCYSSGEVSGSISIGGLVGDNNSSLSYCQAYGNVNGEKRIGGLIGSNSASISDCYAKGDVHGVENIGGLIGLNTKLDKNDSISSCQAFGKVMGNNSVGGLLGTNFMSDINECYSRSDVAGDKSIGGLIGINDNSSISLSKAFGKVTGNDIIGGLVGILNNSTVSHCYATGNVTAKRKVGGLIGFSKDSIVTESYWDIQTSNQETSDGGVGKTTEEMNKFIGSNYSIISESDNVFQSQLITEIKNPLQNYIPNLESLQFTRNGFDEWKSGNINSAIDAFKNAVKCDKNNADAYGMLGALLTNKLDKYAIDCFKEFIRIRPQEPDGYKQLTIVYITLKVTEIEYDSAQTFTTLFPNNADAWAMLSAACIKMANEKNFIDGIEKANEYYEKAIKLDPNNELANALRPNPAIKKSNI